MERRARKGSNFSIIAVAEGAINTEEAKMKRKEWMAKRAEAGYGVTATNRIAAAVQKKTGMETRVCIPGHMQRGLRSSLRESHRAVLQWSSTYSSQA